MADTNSNPFADPQEEPFEDSSIKAVTNANSQSSELDGYNPYAATQTSQSQDPAPSYERSAAQQVDTSELRTRQEELERKAAALEEGERRFRERALNSVKENNWPPLPACCCVKPCFFQDFDLEIPPQFVRIVKTAYYTWIARVVLYLINFLFFLALIFMSVGDVQVNISVSLGFSALWFAAWTVLSFLCWYRPVYKAFRSDSSINFFGFFFVSVFQILVDILIVVGIPHTGYIGLFVILIIYKVNRIFGGIMFIVVILATPILILDIFLLFKVHRLYRATGASFHQARAEFTSGVLRNEAVRNAGAQLAADAAAGAMNNAANQNRY